MPLKQWAGVDEGRRGQRPNGEMGIKKVIMEDYEDHCEGVSFYMEVNMTP